jgi:DNA-binding NtrC family response regulator
VAAAETRKTVLLVDDEEPFLLSLADAFAPHSRRLRVVTAPGGKQAIELVGRFGADLVVTDLKMAGVDGLALLAALARDHANIPIIVMTAYNSPAIETALAAFSPLACFEKPIDPDELVEAVLKALGPPDQERPRRTGARSLLVIPFLLAHLLAPVAGQAFPIVQAPESCRGHHAKASPASGGDWRTALCSDQRA